MKPIWKNGKLTVELHKPDETLLRKARELGEALTAMNQDTGKPLTEAVDAILKPSVADSSGKALLKEMQDDLEE